jgi:hypothetical protein
MFLTRLFRDWRRPRDWKRPWRDPPGFFGPGYRRCNCCAAPSSGPPMIAFCKCSLPTTIHVTFAVTGACSGLSGQTIPLIWETTNATPCDSSSGSYTADFTDGNGCHWTMSLICSGPALGNAVFGIAYLGSAPQVCFADGTGKAITCTPAFSYSNSVTVAGAGSGAGRFCPTCSGAVLNFTITL